MSPEEATLRAFLDPSRRARYLTVLADPRRRRELTARFYHVFARDVDERWAETIDRVVPAADVAVELRRRGAPATATIFGGAFDRTVAPLTDALELIDRDGGAIVICIPGELARYVGEPPSEPTFVLHRPPRTDDRT